MRFFLYMFGLYAVAVASIDTVAKRQSSEQCLAITANISPVLMECMESVDKCLTSDVMGFGQIEAIQSFICPPTKAVRNNIYNVVVGCTDQEYADLLWSGICGSTNQSNGDVVLCTDAALLVNNGSAAKAACCNVDSGPQCANELRQFSSDVGCCTATVIFDAYFDECENGAGLDAMFLANNVSVPSLCDYPLYSSTPSDNIPNIILIMIALCLYKFFH